MLEKILRIKDIRLKKEQLIEEEKDLRKPIISDLSKIDYIYKIFCEILEDRPCPPRLDSTHSRNRFIFIALYLYDPGVLAGGRMVNNMRGVIADVLKCHPSIISHNIDNVMFQCQYYKDFYADTKYLCDLIIERLKNEELVS